jgi:hypothetical protein
LIAENLVEIHYQWQYWYETFCICRHCKRATIFVLAQNSISDEDIVHKNGLVNLKTSVNNYMRNEGFISLKDTASTRPPEYLPAKIDAVFREGAICMSVKCFNAAGTMFRLCIDLATRSMLSEGEVDGLNSRVRRNLGLRLPWLLNKGVLPESLRELSSCIKDDGNDGAHEGNLTAEDAEDLLDFTFVLLERIYTEPERLKLAKERRDTRRSGTS